MTNKPLIETGQSDFRKMVVGVMKTHFPKMKSQVIRYLKCKDFHNETFLDSWREELYIQGRFLNEKGLDAFPTIFTEVFDKHAPKKSDIYDLTIISSLIMKFLRQSWQELGKEIIFFFFCRHRTKCFLLLRKSAKDYFAKLNKTGIDN